jgi:hypothetical protein
MVASLLEQKFRWLKKWKMGDTLRIRKPDVGFWGQTTGFLLVLLVLVELFFRLNFVQDHLSAASIGSRQRQLEIQFARLDRLVEKQGPVDCIFLGNSMVWLGVNPQVVTQVFAQKSGQDMRCFNFGVSAMPASSAGLVASILVDQYHPSLLIYGIFARDLSVPADAEDAYVITDAPWIRYRTGQFNLAGWMYDSSFAYRYKEQMRNLLNLDQGKVFGAFDGPEAFRAYGLDPKADVKLDVSKLPDPNDFNSKMAFHWLYEYEILPENQAGMRQIIDQSEKGVQVIFLELPFPDTAYAFFENGEIDYNRYLEQVTQLTTATGTPFWRSHGQVSIEPAGWWDFLHLNMLGAEAFSEWLGNQMSEAFQIKTINLQSQSQQ